MKEINLTQLIKNNYCYFDSYRKGFFYYMLQVRIGDKVVATQQEYETALSPMYESYQFSIPADDLDGTIMATEKAITLMRWISKAHKSGELIKVNK